MEAHGRPAGKKFTLENIHYCQEFLNYISTVDPHRLKFFVESGIKLPDIANPRYGNSLVGTQSSGTQSPDITLNMLCGAGGVMYANTVKGASDTIRFLHFFEKALFSTRWPTCSRVWRPHYSGQLCHSSLFGRSNSGGMVG